MEFFRKIVLVLFFVLNCQCLMQAEAVNWFLGASMLKPGREIVDRFNKKYSDTGEVRLITGGSGELLTKIYLSESSGFYTPASKKYLELAVEKKLVAGSRYLLSQEVVFGINSKLSKSDITFDNIMNGKYEITAGQPKVMALGGLFFLFLEKIPQKFKSKIKYRVLGFNAVQLVNYLLNNSAQVCFLFKPIAIQNSIEYVKIPKIYSVVENAYLITLKSEEKNSKLMMLFEKFVFENRNIFEKYGYKVNYEL